MTNKFGNYEVLITVASHAEWQPYYRFWSSKFIRGHDQIGSFFRRTMELSEGAFSIDVHNLLAEDDFVVVNLNAPMPPGPTHVDVPTFRGATRDHYPLGILIAMGASELFEQWRVIQAGAVSWFYDGPGGNFEYWPEGLDGPMLTERPPFHNVAIMADNDRVYHRIGRVGALDSKLPSMTAAAEIRPAGREAWEIVENGEVRAAYPSKAIHLSIVWKADLETPPRIEPLTLDRVMDIFTADLHRRNVECRVPTNPLSDQEWRASLLKVYAPAFASSKQ